MKARIGFAAAGLALAASLSLRAETPNPSGRTTADVLARLETFATAAMAEERVPGMAYAVVKDGEVVFAKGFGARRLGTPGDVGTETLFQIGSTTKAFTSALVAMEVDAGKVAWDDRVVTLLPDFRLHDPWVTAEFRVCDLMSQRSGMPAYALDAMLLFGFGRADVEKAMAHVEPSYSFRNGFGYVNNLWLTAARLVETLEGTTWEEAIAARILQPLGMRESTTDPELVARVADRATGHYVDAGGAPTPIPDDWAFRDTWRTIGPAGSIWSTIRDFARWAAFQLGHGTLGGTTLLSRATVDALHAPRTHIAGGLALGGRARAVSYGLGWLNEELPAGTIVWHNGGTQGQHSIVALYELPNVALVVLTNSNTNLVPERMRLELLDLLQVPPGATPSGRRAPDAIPAAPPGAPREPLAPVPPLPSERYVGTYENPAYGRVTVALREGALVLSGGPRPLEGALAPWSGNTFAWQAPFGLPPEHPTVTFTVPPGAVATQLVVSACREAGGGLFVRVP